VASIRRWARRDTFGQTLMGVTDEISAPDDRTIQFRLKQPFPFLPEALGKIGVNMLPIMPERLASTDAFKQVTEMVGSGPLRFVADERVVGSRVVYAKFDKYVPRAQGTPDWTAGPKIVHFDRVVWNVIPDPATASAAMQRNEADWWEQPSFDLLPLLRRDPALVTSLVDVSGNIGLVRFNHLFAPFNNPEIRRSLLRAMNQADFMQAVAGEDRAAWHDRIGFFAPGTPMASEDGLAALDGPHDAEAARAAILKAGYQGEKVVVMTPSDYPRINALCLVAADLMQRCGLNVEVQSMDWGTVIQRRSSKAPTDKGGWSVFVTTLTGADMSSPAGALALRGNGENAWLGWPTAPELERLRNAWLAAPDLATQQKLAAEIQAQAFIDVPYLPLGQFFQPTVRRRELVDGVSGMTVFWGIRRSS
jgi:peptide/nickel transport system substrate-binding protein